MSHKAKIIGITGTNGKTSTLMILENIFNKNDQPLKKKYKYFSSKVIEKPALKDKIEEACQKGTEYIFLELSPCSLSSPYLKSINFNLGVITNLYPPYSNSLNSGKNISLQSNFKLLEENSIALINADNPLTLQLADITKAQVVTYALEYPNAMVTGKEIELKPDFSRFQMVVSNDLMSLTGKNISPFSLNFYLPLPGRHNIYNGLVAAGIALMCDMNCRVITEGLSTVQPFKRCLEVVYNRHFKIIDNCAANPGGLQSAFETISLGNFKNIVVVFALQGSQNIDVNSSNGEIIAKWSSKLPIRDIIITKSINQVNKKNRVNRWEEKAFLEKCQGIPSRVSVIPDLSDALQASVSTAEEGDLILLLGEKGMEAGASLSQKIIDSYSGFSG